MVFDTPAACRSLALLSRLTTSFEARHQQGTPSHILLNFPPLIGLQQGAVFKLCFFSPRMHPFSYPRLTRQIMGRGNPPAIAVDFRFHAISTSCQAGFHLCGGHPVVSNGYCSMFRWRFILIPHNCGALFLCCRLLTMPRILQILKHI